MINRNFCDFQNTENTLGRSRLLQCTYQNVSRCLSGPKASVFLPLREWQFETLYIKSIPLMSSLDI